MAGTVTIDLKSRIGTAQASLSGLSWAWFDEDVGSLNAPTDQGSGETTDASGTFSVTTVTSVLTTGQVGTLVLYDPTGPKIMAYRVAVS